MPYTITQTLFVGVIMPFLRTGIYFVYCTKNLQEWQKFPVNKLPVVNSVSGQRQDRFACHRLEAAWQGSSMMLGSIPWSADGDRAVVNALKPEQNGRHFADDIFKLIFFNEYCCVLIQISLKFVSRDRTGNTPQLAQIMDWRRAGDKSLSEPMVASQFTDTYAPLGLNALTDHIEYPNEIRSAMLGRKGHPGILLTNKIPCERPCYLMRFVKPVASLARVVILMVPLKSKWKINASCLKNEYIYRYMLIGMCGCNLYSVIIDWMCQESNKRCVIGLLFLRTPGKPF